MALWRVAAGMALGAALMATTGLPGARAQSKPALVPGQRVKIELACDRPGGWSGCRDEHRSAKGLFLGSAGDTLRLEVEDGDSVLAIPSEVVSRAWFADGTRSKAGAGAATGFLVGAAIGLLIAAPMAASDPGFESIHFMLGAGAGGLAGAVIGLGVGAAIRTDRWTEARLPHSASGIALEHPSARLGVTIRF